MNISLPRTVKATAPTPNIAPATLNTYTMKGRTFDRDPFARHSFIEYRRLRRPSDPTCTWCGNSSARWSITYTVDPDTGRPHDIRGTYCSRSCFRTLNT